MDERLVDLDHVDRHRQQVCKGGIAGAEIIENDAYALGAKPRDFPRDSFIAIAQIDSLRDFDRDSIKRDIDLPEGCFKLASKLSAMEVSGRNVDPDVLNQDTRIEPGANILRNLRNHSLGELAGDKDVGRRFLEFGG
jgi:hypothetical protein